MKKIDSLFQRDRATGLVRDALVSGAEWVAAGHGVATRQYDGTCCLVRGGRLFKRHEVKYLHVPLGNGVDFQIRPAKSYPEGYEEVAFDSATLKGFGWVPVGDGPEDKWHREAYYGDVRGLDVAFIKGLMPDGTYELCGPKVQGNAEGLEGHWLIRHGDCVLEDVPRTFGALKSYLADGVIEGIVWWREPGNPDAGLVKVKGRDFGIRRAR